MFSIKSKIIFAYTVIFGAMLIVFALIIYQSTKQAGLEKLDSKLSSYSVVLQTEIEEQLNEGKFLNIGEIKSLSSNGLTDLRIQLFNKKGKKVISDSLLSKLNGENWKNTFYGKSTISSININGKDYRSLWEPVEAENDTPYVLQTAASMSELDSDLYRLFVIFIIIIPLALILTGLTAYLISKAAFKPVTQMANTAKDISAKSLDKRLQLPMNNDEIRMLGETLNEMIERIDIAFKSQKQFIADASHEIRTPLTIIQTELELAERNLKDSGTKESINIALSEIESLGKLTNSLLTLAKLDASQFKLNLQFFRIDELLVECVQSLRQTAAKKNINLELVIDDAVELNADKDKLKSVFINLIDNAVKYSTSNSDVFIHLKVPGEKLVSILVEDNGSGIQPEELPHIFKRFYRSNEMRGNVSGSGLGLAIVNDLVHLHHGDVTVKSEAGKGTIFTVILPLNNSG